MKILKQRFYVREPMTVARELLGKKLVRKLNGGVLSGLICETEAYLGSTDSASHAFKGKTPRNAVMFGPAGVSYVYFVYGKHYMLNIVTGEEQNPQAVLIRALIPIEGVQHMQRNRGGSDKDLTGGPAKLCQALTINSALNGWDLTGGKKLWVEARPLIAERYIKKGPRIGIDYAKPADRRAARRFWIDAMYIQNRMSKKNTIINCRML
jgi:DNA-3-methyladenine glycosylase